MLDIEDLIADEDVIVTVSHDGYIKRMPIDTYKRQGRGGRGIIGSDTKRATSSSTCSSPRRTITC